MICEHVLGVETMVRFFDLLRSLQQFNASISGPATASNMIMMRKYIWFLLYDWSHACCNQYKSNKAWWKYDTTAGIYTYNKAALNRDLGELYIKMTGNNSEYNGDCRRIEFGDDIAPDSQTDPRRHTFLPIPTFNRNTRIWSAPNNTEIPGGNSNWYSQWNGGKVKAAWVEHQKLNIKRRQQPLLDFMNAMLDIYRTKCSAIFTLSSAIINKITSTIFECFQASSLMLKMQGEKLTLALSGGDSVIAKVEQSFLNYLKGKEKDIIKAEKLIQTAKNMLINGVASRFRPSTQGNPEHVAQLSRIIIWIINNIIQPAQPPLADNADVFGYITQGVSPYDDIRKILPSSHLGVYFGDDNTHIRDELLRQVNILLFALNTNDWINNQIYRNYITVENDIKSINKQIFKTITKLPESWRDKQWTGNKLGPRYTKSKIYRESIQWQGVEPTVLQRAGAMLDFLDIEKIKGGLPDVDRSEQTLGIIKDEAELRYEEVFNDIIIIQNRLQQQQQ